MVPEHDVEVVEVPARRAEDDHLRPVHPPPLRIPSLGVVPFPYTLPSRRDHLNTVFPMADRALVPHPEGRPSPGGVAAGRGPQTAPGDSTRTKKGSGTGD